VNPFPLAWVGRAYAYHNPMDPFGGQRAGLFRPRLAQRIPRQIPDGRFDELFAALGSHRDRALLAFWICTGARASELLGVLVEGIDPGQQLVTVIRKGSRAVQQRRAEEAVSMGASMVSSPRAPSSFISTPLQPGRPCCRRYRRRV